MTELREMSAEDLRSRLRKPLEEVQDQIKQFDIGITRLTEARAVAEKRRELLQSIVDLSQAFRRLVDRRRSMTPDSSAYSRYTTDAAAHVVTALETIVRDHSITKEGRTLAQQALDEAQLVHRLHATAVDAVAAGLRNLDPDQLDGLACVHCRRTTAAQVPLDGFYGGRQLFACEDRMACAAAAEQLPGGADVG